MIRKLIATAVISISSISYGAPPVALSTNPAKFLLNDFDLQVTTKVSKQLSVGSYIAIEQPVTLSIFNRFADSSTSKFGAFARFHFNEAMRTGSFIGFKATRDQVTFESMRASNGANVANSCHLSAVGYALDSTLGYGVYSANSFHSEFAIGYRYASLSDERFWCPDTEDDTNLGIPSTGFIADLRIGLTF
ncbi:DUF3575 domain-containing protein [Salinibius halmophilus]|uniref:DUF3575 domain-containing protein n=1 Tax=Salinibius halmophilus TaxID=1853216 RepID=UPI00131419FA|nr:DUF3575 domain-containing protein [Salinibius halmophilus]